MRPSWPDCAVADRAQFLAGKSYTAFMAGSSIAKVISPFDSSCGSLLLCFDFWRADPYCSQNNERLPLLAALSNTVVAWAAGAHSRMASSVLSFCAVVIVAPVLHRREFLATSPSTESQAIRVHYPPSPATRCTRWRLEYISLFPHPCLEFRRRTRPRTPSVTRRHRASRLQGRHGTRPLARVRVHPRQDAAR